MICKKCKKDKKIVNKFHGFCLECNNSRLSGEKEPKIYKNIKKVKDPRTVRRTVDKNESKGSMFFQKEEKVRIHTVIDGGRSFGKTFKIKQDEDFYEECFNLSDHKCEECGKELPTQFRDDQGKVIARFRYSHIIPKSIEPKLRHDINNINHLCLKDHTRWDFGDKENMKIYFTNAKRFPQYF